VLYAEQEEDALAVEDLLAYLMLRPYGPDAEQARERLESLGVDPDGE
jgi:hypothetical protein